VAGPARLVTAGASPQNRGDVQENPPSSFLLWLQAFVARFLRPFREDPVVHAYGVSMLAAHGVAWGFLASPDNALFLLADAQEDPSYCWPHFEACWRFRLQTHSQVMIVLGFYLAVIGLTAALLFIKRHRSYWLSALAMNACLFAIVSLDYRLRGNYFYMLFWLAAVYLFWPAKRWAVPLIIVSFYVWAGRLKLNTEWLSGSIFYAKLWLIPERLYPAACAYVVVLELVFIWGLLAKRPAWLAFTLVQLVLFHLQSLSQIHWVYPGMMASILSWFVLERVLGRPEDRANLAQLFRGGAPRSAYVLCALFGATQLLSLLYEGDVSLTGQGRVYALHMFESKQVCDVKLQGHFRGQAKVQEFDLKDDRLELRLLCDPIVYLSRARHFCRTIASQVPDLESTDWVMKSRRGTEPDLHTIIEVKDVCRQLPAYRLLGSNGWLAAH
jgi:hypothetical protein